MRKYPGLYLMVFVIGGIILADQSLWPPYSFLSVAAVAVSAGFILIRQQRRSSALLLFALGFLFFSAFNFAVRYRSQSPHNLESLLGETERYHIFGEVSDWPSLKKERTEVTVAVDSLVADSRVYPARGKLLLKINDTTTSMQRGDRLEFYGRIHSLRGGSGPGGFDYPRFLRLKGIFGIVYLPTMLDVRIDPGNQFGFSRLVDKLRNSIRNSFYRNLSPSAAALATGFLIGETRGIETDVYRMFRDSGTLHLLAVSGSNVALVLLFAMLVLRPLALSRTVRSMVLLGVIVLFAMLSYLEPSVLRASIMATLVIFARLLGRRYHLNHLIGVTALIILLVAPTQLFDVGFQLSFVTAWGLIFILPQIMQAVRNYRLGRDLLTKRADLTLPETLRRTRLGRVLGQLQVRNWGRWLLFSLTVSVVAQIASAPIIAYYFHQIPVISPLANLVIVPAVSLAVVGSLVVLTADLLWPVLGLWAGSFLDGLLSSIVGVLRWMGGEDMPLIRVSDLPVWLVLSAYALLVGFGWGLTNLRVRRAATFAALFVLNGALVAGVVETAGRANGGEVDLLRIPGGIVAVIRPQPSGPSEVVITGMIGRSYPVEEVIIVPALRELGIREVNSITVLGADYAAIDDILRLADRTGAGALHVRAELVNSFKDAAGVGRSEPLGCSIGTWSETFHELSGEGLYPAGRCLYVRLGNVTMLVTDRPGSILPMPAKGPEQNVLVIGQSVEAGPESQRRWALAGFDLVVLFKD